MIAGHCPPLIHQQQKYQVFCGPVKAHVERILLQARGALRTSVVEGMDGRAWFQEKHAGLFFK
jgi:hypothetical protein